MDESDGWRLKLQVKASKECGACGDQALRHGQVRNEAVFGHDSAFYLGSSVYVAITKTSGTLTLSTYTRRKRVGGKMSITRLIFSPWKPISGYSLLSTSTISLRITLDSYYDGGRVVINLISDCHRSITYHQPDIIYYIKGLRYLGFHSSSVCQKP